jgi:hypothetical protein
MIREAISSHRRIRGVMGDINSRHSRDRERSGKMEGMSGSAFLGGGLFRREVDGDGIVVQDGMG